MLIVYITNDGNFLDNNIIRITLPTPKENIGDKFQTEEREGMTNEG